MQKYTLPSWLPQVLLWEIHVEGVSCLISDQAQPFLTRVLSDTLLAAVHPDLPQACRLTYRHNRDTHGIDPHGGALLGLLQHYTQPCSVVTTQGRRYWLSNLYELQRKERSKTLVVHACTYRLHNQETSVIEGQLPKTTPPYVFENKTEKLVVAYNWLDQHFPEWDARLTTGETLDLSGPDLLSYLFQAAPIGVAEQSLPDMQLI